MEKDYLIIGQGIAGTVLAFVLLQQGKSVIVVDENELFTSSKVAAGLYNPIVFKRIIKSWMVDKVLPEATTIYAEMEEKFGKKFHHKREIVKLFSSDDEKFFWQTKAQNPELATYLSNETAVAYCAEKIQNPFACSFVKQSGNTDVTVMLDSMKEYLQKLNSYHEEKFSFEDLKIIATGVEWKEIKARKLIFCEGYKATKNPFFSWLPFLLTKGEILIVHIENFDTDKVINKGVFILPLGNNLFKVGATYEWKDLSESPTEKGKTELMDKLKQVLKIPFKVIAHHSGIRPTVKDRRPIIGLHPEHPQLGIFNGMGTKAVLLAPYFAKEFAGFLEGINELSKEVTIQRFYPDK